MKHVSIPAGASLPELYRQWAGDYPKFFKMDTLSKLGFLLTEMLVHDEPDRFTFREDRAVLVFSREGCVANDRHYAESMKDFPSPALFVYTLPNMAVAEVAMRNHYHGETSLYLLAERDKETMRQVLQASLLDSDTDSVITGWLDYYDHDNFVADLYIVERTETEL